MTAQHRKKKAERRTVVAGYPKTAVFQTPEEVYDYFNAERITCLLCGKQYKALAFHLAKIHDCSSDDYKEMYGLPWGTGLTGTATRALNIEHGKEGHRSGRLYSTPESLAKASEAARNQRKRAPMRDVLSERTRLAMTQEALQITHDGKTMKATEWAEELGIHPSTIYKRLDQGKTVEEALSTDYVVLTDSQVEEIRRLLAKQTMPQHQIAKIFGIAQATVSFINTGITHTNHVRN